MEYLKKRKKQYLNLKKIKRIANSLDRKNIRKIVITGIGEPTIPSKKFVQLVTLLRKRRFHIIGLVTNGSFLFKRLRYSLLKELKNIEIVVISLDVFHLPFLNLRALARGIRKLQKGGIKIRFKAISSPSIMHENEKVFKKLAYFLGSNFFKILLLPVGIIFSSSTFLPVIFSNLERTVANEKKIEKIAKEIKLKYLVFSSCSPPITFDPYGNILPCCGFHVLNVPNFF